MTFQRAKMINEKTERLNSILEKMKAWHGSFHFFIAIAASEKKTFPERLSPIHIHNSKANKMLADQ